MSEAVIYQLYPHATNVTILAGGVVSTVCQVEILPDFETPVVIKCTTKRDADGPITGPFFQRDLERLINPAPDTHLVDLEFLLILQQNQHILVPEVLAFDRDSRVTIMRDFRQQGFTLLQELLINGVLSATLAMTIGQTLANLVAELSNVSSQQMIQPAEDSLHQLEERSDELRVTLGYDPEFKPRVEQILNRFLHTGQLLVATDTHPKNMAVNGDQVMVFDFGRTIYADPQFTLPNFAAHIGLGILGGCVDLEVGKQLLQSVVQGYSERARENNLDQPDEPTFAEYFLMELLHRGKGARWIDSRIFQSIEPNVSAQEVKDSVAVAVEILAKRLLRMERDTLTIDLLIDQLLITREQIEQGDFLFDYQQ